MDQHQSYHLQNQRGIDLKNLKVMNKFVYVFFFCVLLTNAQNKIQIKDYFYSQNINDIDIIAIENGFSPKEKIYLEIDFKSNEKGKIFDIDLSEDDKIFEESIKLIISSMPNLNPEEYISKGKIMRYKLGMRFKLPSKKNRRKIREDGKKIRIDFEYFSIKEYFPLKDIVINDFVEWHNKNIDFYPLTDNCKNNLDKNEIKECVSREINSYVNLNFDTGIASEVGISSNTYKIDVIFFISKKGEVVNISAEGSVPELKEEGIRVINNLPDFLKPAIIDDEPVNLKYVFPIRFRIM